MFRLSIVTVLLASFSWNAYSCNDDFQSTSSHTYEGPQTQYIVTKPDDDEFEDSYSSYNSYQLMHYNSEYQSFESYQKERKIRAAKLFLSGAAGAFVVYKTNKYFTNMCSKEENKNSKSCRVWKETKHLVTTVGGTTLAAAAFFNYKYNPQPGFVGATIQEGLGIGITAYALDCAFRIGNAAFFSSGSSQKTETK